MLHSNLPLSKPKKALTLAISLLSAGSSSSLLADESYMLDEVVVTASRTAETVEATLAPVTVITRKDIERSQASSVTELLNRTPGLQIAYSGGPGSHSGVYMRGTKTAQTLILVDGHKTNTASSGTVSLEYLDPSQIERIEIVRGPRSSLYGADAVGGVINIFTKEGSGSPTLMVKAGGGSRLTGEYAINYGGKVNNTQFNLGAKLYETKGYDRTVNKLGSDADDDAYRNKSFSGNLSHSFANNIKAGIRFAHSEGKAEYDNDSTWAGYPVAYFKVTNISSFLTAPLNGVWTTKLDVGLSRDEREDKGSQYPRDATNKRYSVSWVNDIDWQDNQLLTAGLDYTNEQVDSSSNYSENGRYNTAVFVQNLSEFGHSDLQLGLRHDKNQAYGENTTGNIAWGVELPSDMRLIASYGTAFRAPTFYDLYGAFGSDSTLKPEKSKNTEVELRGRITQTANWSVNVFQNDMKNMLEYDVGAGKMRNIAEAQIRGVEFSLSSSMYGWDIKTSLSFINPENKSDPYSGKTLYRRANELFSLDADHEFNRWSVGGTLRVQGASWNDQANTTKVPGFATIDLRASLQITSELKTQLKVVNLMDKEYTTTKGYIDEPRGVFASLIWTPEL